MSSVITVEEFCAILEGSRGVRHELHHGVFVERRFATKGESETQRKLVSQLDRFVSHLGVIGPEFAFRPLPEYEIWVADVVFISRSRVDAIPDDDYLRGAPELVIEVLSLTDSAYDVNEREAVCLENGCLEFWVVNAKLKSVKVSTPDRKTITYIVGDKIPLSVPATGELAVSEIFSNT
jgi:Uma2 family endonuclease